MGGGKLPHGLGKDVSPHPRPSTGRFVGFQGAGLNGGERVEVYEKTENRFVALCAYLLI